jgi:predicted esterase YcpF (UPF0227 family)
MTKPVIRIYTAADEYIDREMNAAEFAQYKIDQADYATKKAQEEARATQRQALLDRLGITAEEATLLLS